MLHSINNNGHDHSHSHNSHNIHIEIPTQFNHTHSNVQHSQDCNICNSNTMTTIANTVDNNNIKTGKLSSNAAVLLLIAMATHRYYI